MGLKEYLKELWMVLTVPPNSPKGLIHRAERIERDFGKDHPYASALRKQAAMKRAKEA